MADLKVRLEGTRRPYVIVPLEKTDALMRYLAENGIIAAVEFGSERQEKDKREEILDFDHGADVELIQNLLDRWEYKDITSSGQASGTEEAIEPDVVINADTGTLFIQAKHQASGTFTPPASFIIVWDPELISESDYADMVTALGDIVRASGGEGIQRIRSRGYGVPCEAGVTL